MIDSLAIQRIHEGALPDDYRFGYEPMIFDTHDYRAMQPEENWQSYYFLNDDSRTISAAAHFQVRDDRATGTVRAPFGSFDSAPGLAPLALYNFIADVQSRLKALGVRELTIINPPRAYDPERLSLVETFLINEGFGVMNAEPGAVIHVSAVDFGQRIGRSQFQRAEKARSAGLQYQMLAADRFQDVFDFLADCHEEKGYPISIDPAFLKALVKRFPDRYLLSVVADDDTIVSAAVTVKVSSRILYNFLVNHDKRLSHLSPPLLLMEGLYKHCQDFGISMLDLGTSALGSSPNFPLLDFKLRIGGVPTSKLSFFKKLA